MVVAKTHWLWLVETATSPSLTFVLDGCGRARIPRRMSSCAFHCANAAVSYAVAPRKVRFKRATQPFTHVLALSLRRALDHALMDTTMH